MLARPVTLPPGLLKLATTPLPTGTRVPEGGACTDTAQCGPGLVCADNVCTAFPAPAPAVSGPALALAFAVLLAIAAVSLRLVGRPR